VLNQQGIPDFSGQLTPAVFHIMLALGRGELHGYGIMQEVDRLTEGRMSLGPGTLYRSLQKMLRDGLIVETEGAGDGVDDERRRTYRLSDVGRAVAAAEARRLEGLLRVAGELGFLGGAGRSG
jgi:DNA-binding PadR family transcriptional regulator